nr:Retrovirus-related Pol polyprotein from transposon RE1 [Ipomoea batatas]
MAATDATPINPIPNAGDAANNEPTLLPNPILPALNVEGSHTIPNTLEPGQPLIVVTFYNTQKLTSSNYLTWKIQLEAILIGYDLEHFIYGSKPVPTATITAVRVAIDISEPLKKQMKLKKDNDTSAFIDFRYKRLPTFCFLCGVIGHGDRCCPKRWVALEANTYRESWKSQAMEAVASAAVLETGDKGKEPLFMATDTTTLIPYSDDRNVLVPTVVVSEQKQRRMDEGVSE